MDWRKNREAVYLLAGGITCFMGAGAANGICHGLIYVGTLLLIGAGISWVFEEPKKR